MEIISRYNNIIWLYRIDTKIKWPNVTIFSWIHWDEISWIKATKKLIKNIKSWNIKILNWTLNILVWANREAIKLNKRYIKYNLNRLFIKWNNLKWYEFIRSKELMKILDKSDYLLDLHSTSGPSIPYAFSEIKSFSFVKKMWIPVVVLWWWDLNSLSVSWDTENYINNCWWIWITIESWSHLSPFWLKNSYQIILNYLSNLWLIDNSYFNKLDWNDKHIKMSKVYVCETWNFSFKLDCLENFQDIKKWTLIWLDWNKKIIAENDFVLVMPNLANPKKWEDVFFVWYLI